MTTLTTIAADIRKHSPGVLPESLMIFPDLDHLYTSNAFVSSVTLPDDIAEAILRDAMVRDASLNRLGGRKGWIADRPDGYGELFDDADHGGSLGACYAAWRWAKGLSG